MLYVTTRNDRQTYTAHRAMLDHRGPDGGHYIPFREPAFSAEELDTLLEKPFNQCVAEILNLLLNTRLSSWDLDFWVGRYPVRPKRLGHRLLIAECWHNPDWHFDRMVKNLWEKISQEPGEPGAWFVMALRIGVLFGLVGMLRQLGFSGSVDVAAVSGDFSVPMSAWYARRWGLPIRNIVCCCNENNSLWDLICQGQLRTDGVSVPTLTPEADIVIPSNLERLICGCGGVEEVHRYLEACRMGKTYFPEDSMLRDMRSGIYVSVVSSQRLMRIIPGAYKTHGYLLSPYDALAYGGVQDYRAKFGETNPCLILSKKSPLWEKKTVAKALGISEDELASEL